MDIVGLLLLFAAVFAVFGCIRALADGDNPVYGALGALLAYVILSGLVLAGLVIVAAVRAVLA